MMERLIQIVSVFSPEIASALLASVPVTELRAALPIAIVVFDLHPAVAFVSTVLGNLIPLALVYLILPRVVRFTLQHTPQFHTRLEDWFERLKKRYGKDYSKWGALFLFFFVAVPLPGTGVWTGSVLAVIFRIKPSLAIPSIIAGLLVAGLIVLGATQGVFYGVRRL